LSEDLHELAYAAGIEVHWRDVNGIDQRVSDDSLRAVLATLDFPAENGHQIRDSMHALRHEAEHAARPLITTDLGLPTPVNGPPGPYRITLESGQVLTGHAELGHNGRAELPGLHETGYHRLEFNDASTVIAVAPPRAYTLEDAAGGRKLWGLAVQLYALRQDGDGGIGDFAALASFAKAAATHGADALAISPVHALFSADLNRFSPYAPSNRALLNVLHINEPTPGESGAFVDWPTAGAAKLQALRRAFENFHGHEALEQFRHEGGDRVTRHAIFEAIQASLVPHNPSALDWRNWPEAYRDPTNPAVMRFFDDNHHEVSFHTYLQYRADRDLHAAQQATRDAGMRVGLVADLAVGADHGGSQAWSYQAQVLRGLELGAPPDLLNRAGQSWGITAFSPRGLRNSGFTAFLEMLRQAMRNAGGVRIDHIMGLARLWVIPIGMGSKQGAYLRMPMDDFMRLVALESQRHQAVVIGEDLGTLPAGFYDRLIGAGIAGLRVMWFERYFSHFNPPSNWTRTAVAMTTTHDLPTVAGWWQGTDIAWRTELGMEGDDAQKREEDRVNLWSAFCESGAAHGPVPAIDNPGAAVDAACTHLGLAASTLALLPIEDALGLAEQPNFPGTTNEHPNWRRRLAAPAEVMINAPEAAARLAAINKARRA
jgi:4-alpha-glucanotransferase